MISILQQYSSDEQCAYNDLTISFDDLHSLDPQWATETGVILLLSICTEQSEPSPMPKHTHTAGHRHWHVVSGNVH